MGKKLANRRVLEKYLLGELSEVERSEVAEGYFGDDDLFEELLDVENELLDKLAHGSLKKSQEEAFLRYLANLPDGQHKLAVARVLMQFTAEEKLRAQQFIEEYVPATPPWWQSLLSWPARSTVPQYLITAGFVALLLALLLLFSQSRRLGKDKVQLQAQLVALEKERRTLEEKVNSSSSAISTERIKELEEQLKLEQQANEAQAQHLATLQPTTPVIASWTLIPPQRSTGSSDQVILPRSAKFVSITMPIESGGQRSGARILMQTTTGEQRREQAGLRSSKNGDSVSLKVAAGYFTETSYKLTLVHADKDGVELSQDFYFTVTRR